MRCAHPAPVDVALRLTGEVVARLCPDCDLQLDLDPQPRKEVTALQAATVVATTASALAPLAHWPVLPAAAVGAVVGLVCGRPT